MKYYLTRKQIETLDKSNDKKSYRDIHVDPFISQGKCNRCCSIDPTDFHSFIHQFTQRSTLYCRRCSQYGMFHSFEGYPYVNHSHQDYKDINALSIRLPFELTHYQQSIIEQMSDRIQCKTICNSTTRQKATDEYLLYAVTGAGKSEIILSCCDKWVTRNRQLNIAIVCPRRDVIVDLHEKAQRYFDVEFTIRCMGICKHVFNSLHFMTIHQLIYYKNYFDIIIIDEADAYPYSGDLRLHDIVLSALSHSGTLIYVSATLNPTLKRIPKANSFILPVRFHEKPLVTPRLKFLPSRFEQRIVCEAIKPYISLNNAMDKDKKLLIYVHSIEQLLTLNEFLQNQFRQNVSKIGYIHSNSELRTELINDFKQGRITVLLSTTLLERGLTFKDVDIIILRSHKFDRNTLIQMMGRVDRYIGPKSGTVTLYYALYNMELYYACKYIRDMNQRWRLYGRQVNIDQT